MKPFFLLAAICVIGNLSAETIVLDESFHHIRNTQKREWSSFPPLPEATSLELDFSLKDAEKWKFLTFRQAEVKQTWIVNLNGRKIGQLPRDHNDLEHQLELPPGLLQEGDNTLQVSTASSAPDDIRIGSFALQSEDLEARAGASGYAMRVVDESGEALPCRFTIVKADSGTLALLSASSNDRQAVRTGVVYALDGKLNIRLVPGRYRVYVGRGFEYELLKLPIDIAAGQMSLPKEPVTLRRQVPTPGLVACDAHLHTYEFAKHGDCTLIERLISIAGEGVELPISTEHNQHIDYAPEAVRIGASAFFTPVIGCEVTTQEGHFNSWPIEKDATPAEHKLRPWKEIFRNIYKTPGVKVCILNHGRDIHGGFTPFSPSHWSLRSGSFTDGRILRANGMEVLNSGATKCDPLLLANDWMALVRSGTPIAAFGTSDSHTVNFAIPGQGRTYLPIPDGDPSNLDVHAAAEAVINGQTYVSFGLLTKISHEGEKITASVWGPDWTRAEELTLFVNGSARRKFRISESEGNAAGKKFSTTWTATDLKVKRGQFVVAIATGPGITEAYWPMMPPYQAESSNFTPYVLGISPPIYPLGR
ncbi:MAG: hypothetical protein AAGH89_10135 [Verrucomicrobiota bacterium]